MVTGKDSNVGSDQIISVGIFKQSIRARNQVGIGLSHRPARQHRPGGIDSLESIPGLLKKV